MAYTSKMMKAIRASMLCDSVRFGRDGVVQFKRSYFYRHGMTAEKFADCVCKQVADMGYVVRGVEAHDKWAAWPKTSYFVVNCVIAEKEA